MFENNLFVCQDEQNHCIIPSNALGTNQIIIKETLTIPEEKPGVELINQIVVRPQVTNLKIVPIRDHRCGQMGVKVIIQGLLKENLVYTACLPSQPVHSAQFEKPFYGFVELDIEIKKNSFKEISSAVLGNLLNANIVVADVSIFKTTNRKIDKFLTLLVTVYGDLDGLIVCLS